VRIGIALVLTAIAWGALAFGAVYPWGYWPLLLICAAVGVLSLLMVRAVVPGLGRVAAALAAVAAVVALQLVPLSAGTLASWSPTRDSLLKRYDVLYAMTAPAAYHALSIDASATRIALACFVAFALAVIGVARLTSIAGASALVRGVVAFGALLAVFAIVQDLSLANRTGEFHTVYIYGFWRDPYVNKPFGPFINKNNYAGWMLMALPLAIGYLGAVLARLNRSVRSDWRSRLLAISSPGGAEAALVVLAALAMALSVIVSLSRSGMIAMAIVLIGLAVVAPAATTAPRQRLVRIAGAAALLLLATAWAGFGTIGDRFRDRADASMAGRLLAWQSAAHIIRDYPIAGVGANAFPAAMVTYQIADRDSFWEEAHNDYLQIVSEIGLVGAVLVAAAIVVIAVEVRKRFRDETTSTRSLWIRVGAVAGLCAIALQETVEFSLQIPANAVLFAVLIGLALHRHQSVLSPAPR